MVVRTTPARLTSKKLRASAPVRVLGVTGGAVDAGVVDQNIDRVLVLGDTRGRGGDRGVVSHVDRHEAGTGAIGGGLAAPGVPVADDNGVAQFGQPAGGLVAEALVGPG